MSGFNVPKISDRVAIMGSNGTGKTQFGAWLLSIGYFDVQPYIIIDYKRDELLNSSDRIKEIGVGEEPPKHPGLYIVHPRPRIDDAAMEGFLERVWERENIGLYFDEGYMVPDKAAFPAILTQGRSKNIPSIVLSQRPAWISRFVFSEANHYALFHLSDRDDRKEVRRFMPDHVDVNKALPKFHSWYYTRGEQNAVALSPVPGADEILERIESRLVPPRSRKLI